MKKSLIVSMFILLFALSLNAYSAENEWYMSGNLGLSLLNDSDIGSFTEAELEALAGEDFPAGTSASAELEYDLGWILGVTLGYDFGGYRIESELSYQTNDLDKLNVNVTIPGESSANVGVGFDGDTSGLLLLFNGYYDFNKDNSFRPYITGGIGLLI
jgi:opacity protein-like surface antigen